MNSLGLSDRAVGMMRGRLAVITGAVGTGVSKSTALRAALLLGTAVGAVAFPQLALAIDVSTEQELRNAITAANSGGDPNIRLVGDVSLSSNTAFPTASVVITIDTNGHDISGFDQPDTNTTNNNPGGSVVFPGTVTFANSGDIIGGDAEQNSLPFYSTGLGGVGLSLSGGSLTNEGTITGGTGGENLTAAGGSSRGGTGAVLVGGNHVNNGTIKGGTGGIFRDSTGNDRSQGGVGVSLTNGTFTNGTTGRIEAGVGVGLMNSSPAVDLSGTTTLINYGVIEGTSQPGFASNTAGNQAISANAGNHTIYNYGSILGGDSANTSQAIAATPFGSSRLTVVNAGIIEAGTPGNGIAIQFGNAANNQLELRAGSQITGLVVASAASATDVLRLGGDSACAAGDVACTFDVSNIDATRQYRNFNIFEKTGTGTWTITGQGTPAPWDLYGGTLFMAAGSDLGNGGLEIVGGTLAGFGTVGNTSLAPAGAISPGGDNIGTLTIDGDYTGNGGLLQIQTVLGEDSSETDRLVINGNSAGTTNVAVTNAGGLGGVTTNGIKIVDIGGTSAGTFSLLGDMVVNGEEAVVGGAYFYGLYQGTPTDADGDWYLRTLVNPDDPDAPLFQPAAPVVEAYAGALQSFNTLGSLQQRVGNRSWSAGVVDLGAAEGSGLWGQIETQTASIDPDSSTTGASYDSSSWQIRAGLDGLLSQSEDGSLIAGLNVRAGTISADVSSSSGDGAIDAEGYGVGASLTYYGTTGFYLDGQAQASWFNSNLTSAILGDLVADNAGFGYAFSLEAGQKVALGGGWSLTPQAQLAYSAVDFDDFTDTFGSTVAISDGDGLLGRLGLSADYEVEWQDNEGKAGRTHVYGIANLYHDFLDGTEATIGADGLASSKGATWAGIGLGGSVNWADDAVSLYGEASLKTDLSGMGDSYSLGATGGLRAKW
jgi:fibronectin-binding autotransporter adhesin